MSHDHTRGERGWEHRGHHEHTDEHRWEHRRHHDDFPPRRGRPGFPGGAFPPGMVPPPPPGGWPFGEGGGFGFGSGWRGRGGFRGGPHGRGRGGRRGNVRAAVLALLNERPMHGYEMIQELDQRTGGVWRPSPGSIYPTLQMLEDEGLITVAPDDGGRKSYTLTDAGRTAAAEAVANPPWAEFSEETVSSGHDTREAIAGIAMALKQIAFERDSEQWNRAVQVLTETKRKLYAILAESE